MKALSYIVYPFFVGAAIGLAYAMQQAGMGLMWSTYLPIIMTGIVALSLERLMPERADWRPSWADVGNDALFMAFIQIALARGLMLLALLVLADHAHESALGRSPWPHDWPLWAQVIAMVLAVDLGRYWLHRAFHYFPGLWRFHEVHHSPDLLYTLNTARFHPVEKTLHFAFDTVPFLLLGVAPEVLAGYFLVYSVNGLFQHSNVRLRYGWLNHFIGSAETHRWHHARDPRTASCNFGSTTVIWDKVFGTWRLPRHRRLEIGILNRTYPKGFLRQLWTPFEARQRPSLANQLRNLFLGNMLRLRRAQYWRHMKPALRDPMRVQQAVLRRLLATNARTDFGRRHDFAQIRNHRDFARAVPVQEYENIRADVEAQMATGRKTLTEEQPLCYVRTSGTTGQAKDLPMTGSHLQAWRTLQQMAVGLQHGVRPEAFEGSIFIMVSPAQEGVLPSGQAYGSASGVVARDTPAIVRAKFVAPRAVFEIGDSELKYLVLLRLALQRQDITYMGAANPSSLLGLMRTYRKHAKALHEDVRAGGFFRLNDMPEAVRHAVMPALKAHPDRAAALEALPQDREILIRDLWPTVRLAVSWTCASVAGAAQKLKAELPRRARLMELGYIASELRATLTVGRRAGSGLPTADTHFFEFIEPADWEAKRDRFLTLDQIRKGRDYYILVSTPSGLYRYFINDIVRVTGRLGRMPMLRFAQKGKGVTSITGEKLYEAQAVQAVCESVGGQSAFWLMVADEARSVYTLYIEGTGDDLGEAARLIDAKLRKLNIEYEAKRESGRLEPLAVVPLREGAYEAFKAHAVAGGQREGQFKYVALCYARELRFDIEVWKA